MNRFSLTPVNQEPVETVVPHVEPIMTATIDQQVFAGASPDSVAGAGTRTQNYSTAEKTFKLSGNASSFSSVPLGTGMSERA